MHKDFLINRNFKQTKHITQRTEQAATTNIVYLQLEVGLGAMATRQILKTALRAQIQMQTKLFCFLPADCHKVDNG